MRLSNLSNVTKLKLLGFPRGSIVKNPPGNAGDAGSIPGSGRYTGGGHGTPLQYSCLEIPWTEETSGATGHEIKELDMAERQTHIHI